MFNRLHNLTNPGQGTHKRVLCLCSAGLLRSPTVAEVLSREPYGFNTRAAGVDLEYALIPVDIGLMVWADEYVVMETWQAERIIEDYPDEVAGKQIINLKVDDNQSFRSPELVQLIANRYAGLLKTTKKQPRVKKRA
jgi:predicted protein tyrosine phosphatase